MFDASPLIHFARANQVAVLHALTSGFRCVVTKAVVQEVERALDDDQQLLGVLDDSRVEVVPIDDLEVLNRFTQYRNILGQGHRNVGEATVLAWADTHGSAAYVDDLVACNAGRERGVRVYRTLALIIDGYKRGLLDQGKCRALVRQLSETGARFPFKAVEDLFEWARHEGLL